MKIGFFEVKLHEREYLEPKLTSHELKFFEDIISADNLAQDVVDIEILTTHTASKIDQELIEKLPNLKLIATRTTGFDHIDTKAAEAKGITVCNVPSYGEITVAEFAFTLILALSRKIYPAIQQTKVNHQFVSLPNLQGMDLAGKTLGVVGTGRIGQHLIKMATGFDMTILGYDAFPNNSLVDKYNLRYVPFEELLSTSDIISFHVPNFPSTHHMINDETITKIKKGAIIINTARGAVINTESLLKGLDEKIIGGAGLDVLEAESFDIDNADEEQKKLIELNLNLANRENVLIAPHTAFNTKEALERILQTTVENIESFLSGNAKNLVKPPTA